MALPVLLLTLLIASVTDLRRREIPNWLIAAAAVAGVGLAIAEGRDGSSLLFSLLAAAPFLLANLVRPEGMGMGDVKLVAVIGLYLDQQVWIALAAGLALAGLTGVLIALGKRLPPSRTALPLAPFLAIGSVLSIAVTWSELSTLVVPITVA